MISTSPCNDSAPASLLTGRQRRCPAYYDAIIIGAGHNGLTAANVLSKVSVDLAPGHYSTQSVAGIPVILTRDGDSLHPVRQRTAEVDINWKLANDTGFELYHVAWVVDDTDDCAIFGARTWSVSSQSFVWTFSWLARRSRLN